MTTGRPAEVLRRSEHHERFLEHNRATRDLAAARALLDAEWRYLGPLLAGRPRPRVLDLGCGSGPFSVAWSERGAGVVGVDFDHGLLVEARARGAAPEPGAPGDGAAPRWACSDATRLPLRAAAFDVVYCNSLLEHVPDWRALLAEIARVLAPGGVAVIYTTNRHCPLQQEVNHFPFYSWLPDPIQRRVLAWIMAHRRDLVNYTDFPAIHWFTFPQMRRAFAAVGLEPQDRIDLLARRASGWRGMVARGLRGFKLPYYVYAISMGLYGVKRER